MNDELSQEQLTRLYHRFKKRGERALKPCSETQLCQLLDFIEDKIQNMLVMQGRLKLANPTYPHDFEPEGLQSDKRALEIVNYLLQNGRPPEPENTSDEQPTGKTGFDFTLPEAALYLAYTGQHATTDEEAKKVLHLFKRFKTAKKLTTSFNEVRNAERRKRLARILNGESKTKITNHQKRIEKVMPYLSEEQKTLALDDLDYITEITS